MDDEISGGLSAEDALSISTRSKWQIRFSDSSDSPYSAGYIPLSGSSGEVLWRTPSGGSFTIYDTDQDEPSRTSRLVASIVHRLRSESGLDFQVVTKQAVLLWTDFEAPENIQPGKRVVNKPRDKTRRVVICHVIRNPVYDEWAERQAAEVVAAASGENKRPVGRPPKPKPEFVPELPKRPRGRPRKSPQG